MLWISRCAKFFFTEFRAKLQTKFECVMQMIIAWIICTEKHDMFKCNRKEIKIFSVCQKRLWFQNIRYHEKISWRLLYGNSIINAVLPDLFIHFTTFCLCGRSFLNELIVWLKKRIHLKFQFYTSAITCQLKISSFGQFLSFVGRNICWMNVKIG